MHLSKRALSRPIRFGMDDISVCSCIAGSTRTSTHTQHNNTQCARAHTHTLSLSLTKSACGQHRGWLQHGRSWPFAALALLQKETEMNRNYALLPCSFGRFAVASIFCFCHYIRTDVPQTPWLQRKQRSNLDSVDCDRFSPSHHDLLHHVKPFPRMWLFFVVATPLSSSLEVNSMVHAECLVI